jgi:hypothetical protein
MPPQDKKWGHSNHPATSEERKPGTYYVLIYYAVLYGYDTNKSLIVAISCMQMMNMIIADF